DRPSIDYILEEYLEGQLLSFDGLVDRSGEVVFASSLVYGLTVLDSVRGADMFYWIDREIAPDLDALGRHIVRAFGVRERPFHFEFFRLRGGARNPGAGVATCRSRSDPGTATRSARTWRSRSTATRAGRSWRSRRRMAATGTSSRGAWSRPALGSSTRAGPGSSRSTASIGSRGRTRRSALPTGPGATTTTTGTSPPRSSRSCAT